MGRFFLFTLTIDKTIWMLYNGPAVSARYGRNLPLYTPPAFLSREISHKFQFYFFPLFGYFANRQIKTNLLYYIMSGGKSKTYGKAVPLTIIPEADTRNASSVACRTNFQKSLKNPLTNRSTYGIMNTSNERDKNKMTSNVRPPP